MRVHLVDINLKLSSEESKYVCVRERRKYIERRKDI